MKKQLLIAAVAATMTSVATADISITGDAKFEYFNTDNAGTKTNETNTEVNLGLTGKNGDTTVVANIELSNEGAADGGAATVDYEDLYMTTKVGDVSIKAGNYASSTSGILGEIEEGGRATSKITVSTNVGGATIYAGNSDLGTTAAANGKSDLNGNMFAGISMDVAGVTVQAKKNSETISSYGVAGSVSGVDFRLEQLNSDNANSDVTFGNVTTSAGGFDLGYAWIDADATGLVDETDSAIFAVEMGGITSSTETGQAQFSAKTSVAGNAVTLKTGTIEDAFAANSDMDYTQISASRALASGATATVTYTDQDASASTSKETLEIDLSVKF